MYIATIRIARDLPSVTRSIGSMDEAFGLMTEFIDEAWWSMDFHSPDGRLVTIVRATDDPTSPRILEVK